MIIFIYDYILKKNCMNWMILVHEIACYQWHTIIIPKKVVLAIISVEGLFFYKILLKKSKGFFW